MARTELRVTVVAARDLKRDEGSGLRPMSVYSLLWIDPALKLATRVHVEGGRHPVWNDEMVFTLGEDVPLLPHSAITTKVICEVRSQGSWRNSTLLGTAYLPLRDIATIKAMRENPEDADIVQLQLITPGGHAQGSISLSISLIDSSRRRGLSSIAPLLSDQRIQPAMGYPVGFRQPTPYEVHQQASSSDMEAHVAANFQAYASSGHWDFPVGLAQSGGSVQYYPPGQEGSSDYIQTQQSHWPWLDQSTRLQRRRNMTLALIVGAVAGFVIGDILGVFFR